MTERVRRYRKPAPVKGTGDPLLRSPTEIRRALARELEAYGASTRNGRPSDEHRKRALRLSAALRHAEAAGTR
jgi:hypothetical protein